MTATPKQEPFREYLTSEALNFSRLKRIDTSPLDYSVNYRKDTDALGLGRIIHTAVLEPQKWSATYSIYEGERKAGDEWEAFQDSHLGADIISLSDASTASAVARAVNQHAVAGGYAAECKAELSIYWKHPIGFDCKSRVDWLADDYLVDLKTARNVTARQFSRQAANLNYHAQIAFYLDAAKALDGRERKAILLAVEKEPPFDVAPYVLPEEAIAAGRRAYQDWMLLLLKCRVADHWPGVAEFETELHLPEWAFSEWDDARLDLSGMEIESA